MILMYMGHGRSVKVVDKWGKVGGGCSMHIFMFTYRHTRTGHEYMNSFPVYSFSAYIYNVENITREDKFSIQSSTIHGYCNN